MLPASWKTLLFGIAKRVRCTRHDEPKGGEGVVKVALYFVIAILILDQCVSTGSELRSGRGPRCGTTRRHDRSGYCSGRSCYRGLHVCDCWQAPLILTDASPLTPSTQSLARSEPIGPPTGGGSAGRPGL